MADRNRYANLALPLLLALGAAGCADLGQVAVVEARKSFRVPVEGVEVEVPTAGLEALVAEQEIADLLVAAGATQAELDALGVSLYELGSVGAVIPLSPILDDLEALVVARMQAELDDGAREALDGDTMRFESDFSAWDAWELDFADPDRSIAEALAHYPVVLRLVIEAESLSALVGDGAADDGGGDAQDQVSELEELTDLGILRGLFLQEVGLRTLAPDEIEPEGGWSDEERQAAEAALRDPARVDDCGGARPTLDPTLGARVTVQSLADPFVFATVGEVALDGADEVCGVTLEGQADANLQPYFDGGLRLVIAVEGALGVEDFWLGGYLRTGVVARLELPGSVTDLSNL